MRSKEEANDYRYFPDPDLLPLEVTDAMIDKIKSTMPELPATIAERFEKELGLSSYDALELTSSREVTNFFTDTIKFGSSAKLSANWILGSLFSQLKENDLSISSCPILPTKLAALIKRIEDQTISNNAAKKVFDALWQKPASEIDGLIDELGLKQISDSGAIDQLVDEVMQANISMVDEFKSGKDKAFNALVGQVMKASKGKANPTQVSEILKKKLIN